jgi:hypothetical protein
LSPAFTRYGQDYSLRRRHTRSADVTGLAPRIGPFLPPLVDIAKHAIAQAAVAAISYLRLLSNE